MSENRVFVMESECVRGDGVWGESGLWAGEGGEERLFVGEKGRAERAREWKKDGWMLEVEARREEGVDRRDCS